MSNKERDTRSHNEKYAAAKTAFDLLKEQAEQTGKKIVSISAVAIASHIDRGYLYGKINTPDDSLNEKFRKLGNAIARWKKNFSDKLLLPDSDYENELKREKKNLKNSVKQNALLMEKHHEMSELYNQVCDQRDVSQDDLTKAEAVIMKLQAKAGNKNIPVISSGGISQLQQKPVIISPDYYHIHKDRYTGTDSSYRRKIAWGKAQDNLISELLNPLPSILYITIGIQGAGKSRWAKQFSHSKRSIIFDATNLTMSDRHDLLRISKSSAHKDLKVVAVCFPVSVEKAKKQNAERNLDRRIPNDVIEDAEAKIEFPTYQGVFGHEKFNEILIIKDSS
jgi:hypothetical protein